VCLGRSLVKIGATASFRLRFGFLLGPRSEIRRGRQYGDSVRLSLIDIAGQFSFRDLDNI